MFGGAEAFVDYFRRIPVNPIPVNPIPVKDPVEIRQQLVERCRQLRSEILYHVSVGETLEIFKKIQNLFITERESTQDIMKIMREDIECEEEKDNFIVTKLLEAYIIDLDLESEEDVKKILRKEGVVLEPDIEQQEEVALEPDIEQQEEVALESDIIEKPPVFTTKPTPAPVVREATQKSCWQRFTDLFQCC